MRNKERMHYHGNEKRKMKNLTMRKKRKLGYHGKIRN